MMLLIPVISLLCFQQTLAAVSIVNVADGHPVVAQVGESPMFQCTAPGGTTLEWVATSLFETVLTGDPPLVITSAQVGGQQKSYLTIEGVTTDDAGDYMCRDADNPGDRVRFTLAVSAAEGIPEGWTTPEIGRTNPSYDVVHVDAATGELELRCTGGTGDSKLVFEKDGAVIVQDGTAITLTASRDVNDMNRHILIMTHPAEAGEYTCRDSIHEGLPTDSVTVVVGTQPSVQVEITEPSGSVHKVMEGETFRLKCQATGGTDLAWYLGVDLLQDERGGYLVTGAEDVAAGVVTSLLAKEDASAGDGGVYRCVNAANGDQGDSIQVSVRVADRQLSGASVPTEYRHVIMKVGTTVNLECSLEGPGQYRPEWSKNDVVICSGPKYSITMDTKPSSLVVKNIDRTDAGIYKCIFKHRVNGHIGGIIVFNVSALHCPAIRPPEYGSLDLCPLRPLNGDSCTFKCHPEFKLTSTEPLICEQTGGITHWSGSMPSCKRIPAAELEAAMPTSLSHVLLQVGWDLELRCSDPATWNKNGDMIRHGDKYHVRNGHLVIRRPDKLDAGIYDCFVRDATNYYLTGIQKFNVTTMPCPRLHPPKNGSFVQCSSRPVYGETCIFRCNRGFKLVGNKARTCVLTALSHSNTQVYWTGGAPTCSGLYSTNMQFKSGSSSHFTWTSLSLLWTTLLTIVFVTR